MESNQQRSWFGRTNIFLRSCTLGLHSSTVWNKQRYCRQLQNHGWISNFRESNWKITMLGNLCISSWSCDMEGHAKKCLERTRRLNNSTKYLLHALTTIISNKKIIIRGRVVKSMLSQFVHKCLYLERVGRLDIRWSVNKLARSITKWTKNDYLVWSLTFIIHVNTNNIVMWKTLQNNADWGLFQDSDFAGDLENS